MWNILINFSLLSAFLVTLEKLEKQKSKTREEHDNFEAAMKIANTNANYAKRLREEIDGNG